MSDNKDKEADAASTNPTPTNYDPSTLLALYSSAYGGAAASSGAAANAGNGSAQAAGSGNFAANSLGLNQWWTMASQLAAQEYLARIQAAARDPQAYAALAAQGVLPNYEMLTSGSKSRLKLPNDTEIIKYTSSATGSKAPGTSTRGRKKTISLDPTLSNADYASLAANVSSSSNDSTPPSIPAGLTIERKRPGSQAKSTSDPDRDSPASIDRVEITKIPAAANGSASPSASSFMPKSSTPKPSSAAAGGSETPLNLSTKSSSPFMSPIVAAAAAAAAAAASSDSASMYTSKSIGGSKIPQEYYACELR